MNNLKPDILVVVTSLKDWNAELQNVRVVTARSYLTEPEFAAMRRVRIFNLCRNYKYQSYGYYVSLLAEARGHRIIPSIITMQDLKSPAIAHVASDDLEDKIHKSLAPIQSDKFVLSIYFGKNLAKRHDSLAMALFKYFPAPFLRANFVRHEDWELQNITAIPVSAIPEEHRQFAQEAAQEFFSGREIRESKPRQSRFDLAILWDEQDPTSPSCEKAIDRFVRAGEEMGMSVEIIGRDDYGRLSEFDALFIRSTTSVNHYTYRFSRRATAEGLVVIDDPISILKCTNKVYLAELLTRHSIPCPRTRIVHKDNLTDVINYLGYPCILKKPDSSSSLGVFKAEDEKSFRAYAAKMFDSSELFIAQEYMPTEYDWRIGILDRRAIYAAKYYMAPQHWQILKRDQRGRVSYGLAKALPVEDVPAEGLKLALKAANLIGDGLYGVDLKQVGNKWFVIEVNDNPSIDYKVEDRFLRDDLYRRIIGVFIRRLEDRKEGRFNR